MSRCQYHVTVVCGLALTGLHIVQSREGIATVSSTTVPEFGPNDWFVEEKYNQFLSDPSSVEQIWRDFFTDPVAESRKSREANGAAAAPTGTEAPAPTQATSGPAAAAPAAPRAAAPAVAKTPPPPPPPARKNGAAPSSAAAAAPTTPQAVAKPVTPPAQPGGPSAAARPAQRNSTTATPDDLVVNKAAKAARIAEKSAGPDEVSAPLRGASAAVVRNMTASLEVPTATSVRAVPGEADRRQPDRHQQLPASQSRRQGLVHPPHRVRDHPGARRLPEHEPALRRRRRQAADDHAGARQPRPGHRPAGSRTVSGRWWSCRSATARA